MTSAAEPRHVHADRHLRSPFPRPSVQWGQRAIAVAPGANIARTTVAAALAHLGRIDQARAEIVELRRHQPNPTLARMKLSSFAHDWMYDLYLDGLRAGLPER